VNAEAEESPLLRFVSRKRLVKACSDLYSVITSRVLTWSINPRSSPKPRLWSRINRHNIENVGTEWNYHNGYQWRGYM
jgi:hypothetical protein